MALAAAVLVLWLVFRGGPSPERPGGRPVVHGTDSGTRPLLPPPPVPITPPSPPTEATQPPEQPTDPELLLAGITRISVRLTMPEANRDNALVAAIQRRSAAAAKQLGLTLGGNDLPMLEIDARFSNDPDLYIVVLSAELKVRAPGGKTVTAWQHSEQVVSVPRKGISPEQTENALKTGVAEFFDQFVDDVREARAKAKQK